MDCCGIRLSADRNAHARTPISRRPQRQRKQHRAFRRRGRRGGPAPPHRAPDPRPKVRHPLFYPRCPLPSREVPRPLLSPSSVSHTTSPPPQWQQARSEGVHLAGRPSPLSGPPRRHIKVHTRRPLRSSASSCPHVVERLQLLLSFSVSLRFRLFNPRALDPPLFPFPSGPRAVVTTPSTPPPAAPSPTRSKAAPCCAASPSG